MRKKILNENLLEKKHDPGVPFSQNSGELSFQEHLLEFRGRFLICCLVIFLSTISAYQFRGQLLYYLIKPLHGPLFYSAPIGALSFTFTVVFCVGLFLASPILLYEIFTFLSPALPKVKNYVIILLITSFMILFVVGIIFGYFVSLPITLHFFNQFSTPALRSLFTTNEYFSFITQYLISFGVIFEIPIILLCVNSFYRLESTWLFKQQRYVVVVSFLLGAICTPDPLNQVILAGPIVILYQFSVVMIWFVNKKRVKQPLL